MGMELKDYFAALRRNWPAWIGLTTSGALVGLLVVILTPATYQASSRVFVTVSPAIPNSAQFVQQRVKSYPDIVTSAAVLAPVQESLGLNGSLAELRSRISAVNPPDTSQVEITASGPDADGAAAIANAVADRVTDVVEELETPASGNKPVTLTVSDPAVAPTEPASPVVLHFVTLGVLVGLFLGLAAAVVRSRLDPTIFDGEELRRAWGADADADGKLLVPAAGRARRSALTGRPGTTLARRIETAAEEGPVRVVLVSPSPAETRAARALAEEVAAVARSRGLTVAVSGPRSVTGSVDDGGARVRLEIADPLAPLRVWKGVAARHDDVVLVVAEGGVDRAELREMRGILRSAGIEPLAVALVPRGRRRLLSAAGPRRRLLSQIGSPALAQPGPTPAAAADGEPVPPAGRPTTARSSGRAPSVAQRG